MNAPTDIPADMLAAIGNPPPRTPFNDAEIGWMMKVKAREMIDNGEIKTEEEARKRFMIRAQWIADMTVVDEQTRAYWIKFEQKFFASARKYLAELREIKSIFKK